MRLYIYISNYFTFSLSLSLSLHPSLSLSLSLSLPPSLSLSYKLMQCCWKKYASERPKFAQIVEVISSYWDHLNNKRDSYCSEDDDEELEDILHRRPSRPSRTSSVRSGMLYTLVYSSIFQYTPVNFGIFIIILYGI